MQPICMIRICSMVIGAGVISLQRLVGDMDSCKIFANSLKVVIEV
jgi:hypothetical protein